MAESSLLIGIDVGTTKVCALVADMEETPSGGAALRILGVGLAPSQGMRKGVVVDVDQASRSIAEAVDKAQRAAGYEIGAAFVSLAGAHVSSVNSRGVVGISGDSTSSHRKFADKHGFPFLLLSDEGGRVRAQFGVPKTLGLFAGRSTYVIDSEGVIRHAFHSQLQATKHVDEALEAVRGLARAR